MAVTPTDSSFKDFTAERFLLFGDVKLYYETTEGDLKDYVREIPMKPCEDFSFVKPHYSEKQNKLIQAHIAAEQFFCPEAPDLSIFGMATDLEHKKLRVEVIVNQGNTFEDKKIALIMNNRRINLQAERTEKDPLF